VYWVAALLILQMRWVVCSFSLSFIVVLSSFSMTRNGSQLGVVVILAQKFNRRTALEPTTKLSNEALHPPLRQTQIKM
jgi:hypothetical protein